MSRVLVPMSREDAEAADGTLSLIHSPTRAHCRACQARVAIRAALDTDQEELVKAIARELYRQPGVKFEGSFEERVAYAAGTARAVLALLEGADDE